MYLNNRAAELLDKATFVIFYYLIIILFPRDFYFVSSLCLYICEIYTGISFCSESQEM